MPQEHSYQLVRLSANAKLGGLPASATSNDTCPDRCSFKGNGCYAEAGNSGINFRAVSDRKRGTDLDTFCEQVRLLPRRQLWRWAQSGDLPGDRKKIDAPSLHKLVSANRGRSGYGYTHYDPTDPDNAKAIQYANGQGFVLNLSAETLAQADEYVELGVGPVVVTLPADQVENLTTPAGNAVVVCPASIGDTTCALCGVCAVPTRKSIIGFPSHGAGKKRVEAIFWAKPELQAA